MEATTNSLIAKQNSYMKKEIIELLQAIKAKMQDVEQVEYDKDETTRNYFDACSDMQFVVDEAIAECKKTLTK